MICHGCRTANPPAANFCLACGQRLAARSPRPTAERRWLHVVFCDIVGSTPLSERLDPEDLRTMLQQFQGICADVVARLDGYVAQFLGDAVLIYLGYPQAHEDDARRAVLAGLEIVRAVSRDPVGGQKVRVRVGIHSGPVVVGEVGVTGHRAELAVGETPNLAARVQAEAQPDTVVISQQTERLVRGFFETTELGPRSLRGLEQPMTLFQVIKASDARNRLEAAKAGGLTPFVGRAAEMELLRQNWNETLRGRGRVVSIRGEAGVGKSRLVEAFRTRLASDRPEVIQCGCSEHLRNTAFHPFAAAIQHEIQLSGATNGTDREAWLDKYASRFAMSSSQAARVVSDLISKEVEGSQPASQLAPAHRRQLVMEALSSWLLQPDGDCARVVVVEDMHWADASTLELVQSVAETLPSRRVFMVLTFRPEFQAALTLGRPLAVLQLHPFAGAEAILMASRVARGKSLPDGLTSRLAEWTKGVPLYVEEFTKGLLESGVLTEREDRFELAGALPKSLVPATLAGPLAARIDRLATAKPVAQLASVFGVEFHLNMLGAVAGLSSQALKSAVDELVTSDLVVESAAQPGAVFLFRHALLRDAAYESLLLTDRREMHGRVVQVMQRQFPDRAASHPEIVARHASEAGLARLAIDQWQLASKRALARAANWEALAHIDQGMLQLDQLAEGPTKYEGQLAFELARGPALMAVKGYAAPEVKATYRRAHELCTKIGDVTGLYSVLWGLWANQFVAGELAPAKDFGEQVYRLAEESRAPALLVPACHALGYTLCYRAEFEQALKLARQGISLFDLEIERKNVLLYQFSSAVAVRHIASVSLWMLGFPEQSRVEAEQAIELAKSLAHPPTLAYAMSALTWGAPFLLGDLKGMDRAALKVIELSGREEFAFWPPFVQTFRGWAMAAGGDVNDGLAHMRASFDAYRKTGGGILRPTLNALIAEANWKAGHFSEALEVTARAIAEIASTQEHNYEPELYRVRGLVLASRASGPQYSEELAEASLRAAASLAREQHARSLELRAAVSLATFLRERGRFEEGRSLVREVYDSFQEGFDTPDLRAASDLLAKTAS